MTVALSSRVRPWTPLSWSSWAAPRACGFGEGGPGDPERGRAAGWTAQARGAHPFGHSLAEVLHPVGHGGLAIGAQLQARPAGEDDLEGVGPIRAAGPPTAAALLPPGPEEEGERGARSRRGRLEAGGHGGPAPAVLEVGGHQKVVWTPWALRRGLQRPARPTPFCGTTSVSRIAKTLPATLAWPGEG